MTTAPATTMGRANYFDKETNFHYNYFRDYDPSLGRYGQSDPIGLRGGVNTFSYANQNGLQFVDPFGLTGSSAFGLFPGGGAGFGGALPFSNAGFGIGLSVGVEWRECCGPDNTIYNEMYLVAQGGPSFGGSGRVSPGSVVNIVRIGPLPACLVDGNFQYGLLSVDIQVWGGVVQADLSDMRMNIGATAGVFASGVLNMASYTRPIFKTSTQKTCPCVSTQP